MVYLWILRHTSKSDNSVISHCWNWRRSRQGNPKARQATDVKLTNLSHRLTLCKIMLLEKSVSYRKPKSSILKKKKLVLVTTDSSLLIPQKLMLQVGNSHRGLFSVSLHGGLRSQVMTDLQQQRLIHTLVSTSVWLCCGSHQRGFSIPFPLLSSVMSYASEAPSISPLTVKVSISVEWTMITLWSH